MKAAFGKDVLEWPEFKVFAERLALKIPPSISILTITIPVDAPVRISLDARGVASDVFGRDRHLLEDTYIPEHWVSPISEGPLGYQMGTSYPSEESPSDAGAEST